jgi:glycosyltransferase involved in cell wall biosynthesis
MEWASAARPDAVHVMRLYLAPLADGFLRLPPSARPKCVLDLDDDEMQARERLARLAAASGETEIASFEAAEAKKYGVAAKRYFTVFDRVAVCAAHDAVRLGAQFPETTFMAVPNGFVPSLASAVRRLQREGPLRLLLVGTFGCYANRDAAFFLAHNVVPALCRLTTRQIQVDLVGSGGAKALGELSTPARKLLRVPGTSALNPIIKVHDYVEDLCPHYSRADVAVVPLRAGGGTRIKILEAFAHGVPVVSTRMGAEGIRVADEEHLLLADDAVEFARACLRLKEGPELACGLAARASALLHEQYTPAQIADAVSALYAGFEGHEP